MPAPTYDNSINAWSAGNVSSLTSASFAIGGSDRFLVAFISSGAGAPVDPSGMKWGGSGGTALTKQGATLSMAANFKHSCYTLLAPTAQTSTLYGNWPSNQDETTMACVSVTGVDQTTPTGTVATNTGTNNAPTVTATTVTDDFVVDGIWAGMTGGNLDRTLTQGGGQTPRQVVDGANPSPYEAFGTSTKVATGTSTVMSWSLSGSTTLNSGGWGIFAVPLKPAAGGSPIVQAIGQVTETDSANSIAYVFAVLMQQTEETDAALPIIAPIIRAVGLATETEAVQGLIQPHIGLLGLNAETDTVFSLTVKKTRAIGQATETEAGQSLSALKQQGVGLTTESESVQPISATKTKAMGLSAESDIGLGMGAAKAKAVGLSTETDLAQALTIQDATLVGQVAETNAAQAITSRKSLAVGLTQETESGLSVGPVKAKALGLTDETELGFGLSAAKTQAVGLATENDLAQGLAVQGSTLLGQTEEVDEALALSAKKVRSIGLSSDAETGQALTGRKVRTIGLVAENDQAFGINAFHALVQVVETDAGLPMRAIKTRQVGLATGASSSLTILAWKRRAIGLTAEVETAQSLVIEEPPPEPAVAAPRSRTNQYAHGQYMPSRSSRGSAPRRGRS